MGEALADSPPPASSDATQKEPKSAGETCEDGIASATVSTAGECKEEEKEEEEGTQWEGEGGSSKAHAMTCEDTRSCDTDDIANDRFDNFPLLEEEEEEGEEGSDVPEQRRLWRQSQMMKEDKEGGLPKVAIAIISRRSRHRAGRHWRVC